MLPPPLPHYLHQLNTRACHVTRFLIFILTPDTWLYTGWFDSSNLQVGNNKAFIKRIKSRRFHNRAPDPPRRSGSWSTSAVLPTAAAVVTCCGRPSVRVSRSLTRWGWTEVRRFDGVSHKGRRVKFTESSESGRRAIKMFYYSLPSLRTTFM